jgi:hypothetical protein
MLNPAARKIEDCDADSRPAHESLTVDVDPACPRRRVGSSGLPEESKTRSRSPRRTKILPLSTATTGIGLESVKSWIFRPSTSFQSHQRPASFLARLVR